MTVGNCLMCGDKLKYYDQSFEDVMFGYTIPRDFYSGAGASYCGYPFGGLYPIGGLP